MSSKPTVKGKVALEYIKRFPNAKNKTLARKMFRDNPEVFSSLDQARRLIRYHVGAAGDPNRQKVESTRPEMLRKLGTPGDPYPPLPKPVSLPATSPVSIKADRALVLADIHVPYHDPLALEVALDEGVKQECGAVVLLGDIVDFFAVSRWVKDPRERNLAYEIDAARQLLQHIRDRFPDADLYYKTGNHEERWERYLYIHAPEIVGVDAFEMDDILRLKDMGYHYTDRMRHYQVGPIVLVHGHEFWGLSAVVNPARGLYLRAKSSAICGHLHQSSEHVEKDVNGKIVGCWSVGCLCALKQRYAPYSRWNHGFAIVDKVSDALSAVTNHKIIDGEMC
jgi:predicted phosphodiesterase